MDLNKLTQKSQEALRRAQSLAVRFGHQAVDSEHLLAALVQDEEGIVPRLVLRTPVRPDVLANRVETALSRYFPNALRERYAGYLPRHPLKREIISTHVINSMTNRVGSTYVHRLMETTGAKPHEIVRAYLLTREIFGFVELWKSIEALDNQVGNAVQTAMLIDSSRLIERGTTWFLRSRRLGDDVAATIALFSPRVEALATRLPQLRDPAERARVDSAVNA